MSIKITSTKILLGGLFAILVAPLAAGATSATANTTINAVIASVISISTSSPVVLNITPVTGGAQTTASDTVTVSTNDSLGYGLTLADADSNTNLVSGGNTIAAEGGSQASPLVLPDNSWGYRVDGVGGFGAGPTSGSNNLTANSSTFAGVPPAGSPNTIKSTSTTASGDTTPVWYSAKADTNLPNGTYSDTVTYTATGN
jgi:hypothetical protein